MDINKNNLTCEQAKQVDMVTYLSESGFEPAKIRGDDYWYLSPLRTENTPSFKVNTKLNVWYDHGVGKGGNLIDFAILFHDCTVGEFLLKSKLNFSFHQPSLCRPYNKKVTAQNVEIISIEPLHSLSLLQYLFDRRIPSTIAAQHCTEISFKIKDKIYYAIAFKNDSGGYELRYRYFKGSTSLKDITTIKNGFDLLSVFEGFFDCFSFLTLHQNQDKIGADFLILNSLSFFEKSRSLMDQYEHVDLYLNNDSAGQNSSSKVTGSADKYCDKSNLYKHYKDFNDWLVHVGVSQKSP